MHIRDRDTGGACCNVHDDTGSGYVGIVVSILHRTSLIHPIKVTLVFLFDTQPRVA